MKRLTDIQKEVLIAAAAALLLAGVLTGTPEASASKRPNFVIIQTDDQSPQLLNSKYRGRNGKFKPTMPNTVRQIFRSGTEFRNYYTTSPVCSPSRASLLNGQYPRNNNMLSNNGPFGGWSGWKAQAISQNNIPLLLQQSGYRTSHFGKFMNSYFDLQNRKPTRQFPRGWDNWFTSSFKSRDNRFYGYSVNDGGRIKGPYGSRNYTADKRIDPEACRLMTPKVRVRPGKPKERCNYTTDLFTRKALQELKSAGREPFYLQIGYDAPHGDVRAPSGPQPATRHIGKASRTPLITDPNFNEWDFTDKSSLLRSVAPRLLTAREKRNLKVAYQAQLESLMAIDESVGAIVKALRKTGELDNTYIFFLSDHGYFLGEHRFALAKFLPYEASSSVSMAVRGPGVPGPPVRARSSATSMCRPRSPSWPISNPATSLTVVRWRTSGVIRPGGPVGRSVSRSTTRPAILRYRPGLPHCVTAATGSAPTSTSSTRPEGRRSTISVGIPTNSGTATKTLLTPR